MKACYTLPTGGRNSKAITYNDQGFWIQPIEFNVLPITHELNKKSLVIYTKDWKVLIYMLYYMYK